MRFVGRLLEHHRPQFAQVQAARAAKANLCHQAAPDDLSLERRHELFASTGGTRATGRVVGTAIGAHKQVTFAEGHGRGEECHRDATRYREDGYCMRAAFALLRRPCRSLSSTWWSCFLVLHQRAAAVLKQNCLLHRLLPRPMYRLSHCPQTARSKLPRAQWLCSPHWRRPQSSMWAMRRPYPQCCPQPGFWLPQRCK